MHDDATNWAGLAVCGKAQGLGIRGVPRRLVVNQHLDMMLTGRAADGKSIDDSGGERLLNHGAYAMARSKLDGLAVVKDVGVDEGCLGMRLGEHLVSVRKKELVVEMELLLVMLCELGVWFGDTHELDVGVIGQRGEQTLRVAVDEADDSDADGRLSPCGEAAGCAEEQSQSGEGWLNLKLGEPESG